LFLWNIALIIRTRITAYNNITTIHDLVILVSIKHKLELI
jgi:hypothetical protein